MATWANSHEYAGYDSALDPQSWPARALPLCNPVDSGRRSSIKERSMALSRSTASRQIDPTNCALRESAGQAGADTHPAGLIAGDGASYAAASFSK
jgi:hypothetical protein